MAERIAEVTVYTCDGCRKKYIHDSGDPDLGQMPGILGSADDLDHGISLRFYACTSHCLPVAVSTAHRMATQGRLP